MCVCECGKACARVHILMADVFDRSLLGTALAMRDVLNRQIGSNEQAIAELRLKGVAAARYVSSFYLFFCSSLRLLLREISLLSVSIVVPH